MNSDHSPMFHFEPARYPETPGCFLIYDASGQVIYVGKGVNLRRRLATFFTGELMPTSTRLHNRYDDRMPRLVERIRAIEVILLPDDGACARLVNDLIARFHPLFNLATFIEPGGAYTIEQTAENFPRFVPGRQNTAPRKEISARYGPFTSTVRDLLLKSLAEICGMRTCDPLPSETCLSYDLGLCSGPCAGKISAEEYARGVEQAAGFLSGEPQGLIAALSARMQSAAEAMEFEHARRIRDQVQTLQGVFSTPPEPSAAPTATHRQDVIYADQGQAFIFHLERGRIQGWDLCTASANSDAFLREHYQHDCPPELIVHAAADPAALARELSGANGFPVIITIPTGGPAYTLLETARVNHHYRVLGELPARSKATKVNARS